MAIAQGHTHRSEVLHVSGPRLNIYNHEAITEEGQTLIDRGVTELIVDLSEVVFVDSSGIGTLVRMRQKIGGGGTVVLQSPQPFVAKVLELTKMTSIFEIR